MRSNSMRHAPIWTLQLAGLAIALLALASPSHAGFGDTLKKKLTDKGNQKANATVDKATGTAEQAASGDKPASAGGDAAKPAGNATGSSESGAGTSVSTVSTKFDYVPGDSVLLMDDFTQDELGEFPARWRLSSGTFEVAESAGERWLRCTSEDGRVRMKVPGLIGLPEFWTLEFDFFGTDPMGSALTVLALSDGDHTVWEATYPHGNDLAFRSGQLYSSTPLEGATIAGRHHVMVLARGTAIKVYIDRQRLANVPEISADLGTPIVLEIRLWATSKPMITNVRFAEGCRPAKDMLAAGKLVTYGIHFATASDVVLADSAPILRQIVSYMQANPTVKLKITGHTDNVGSAASNLDLSKRRAAAVAKVLSEQLGVAADRFATDGRGDTQSVASNAKPEGRAMNRRVEFAKQ